MLDDTNENSITEVIDSNAEEMLVQDFIQATPFHRRREPLLFPFLVMEAKSEKGGGFSKCVIRTALPIWSLLKNPRKILGAWCSTERTS
jgi:hypothetical protein